MDLFADNLNHIIITRPHVKTMYTPIFDEIVSEIKIIGNNKISLQFENGEAAKYIVKKTYFKSLTKTKSDVQLTTLRRRKLFEDGVFYLAKQVAPCSSIMTDCGNLLIAPYDGALCDIIRTSTECFFATYPDTDNRAIKLIPEKIICPYEKYDGEMMHIDKIETNVFGYLILTILENTAKRYVCSELLVNTEPELTRNHSFPLKIGAFNYRYVENRKTGARALICETGAVTKLGNCGYGIYGRVELINNDRDRRTIWGELVEKDIVGGIRKLGDNLFTAGGVIIENLND